MQQIQLSIPEPCHENWNQMTPNDQGRFCNSCAKTVIDFSVMSDAQLIQYFEKLKNEKVCGRVYPDQLERAISIAPAPAPRKKFFAYWQYVMAFLLMWSKGQPAKAQGDIKGKMVAQPDTLKPIEAPIRLGGIRKMPLPKTTKAIGGALPFYFITDENGQPVANASVQMLPAGEWLQSDSTGRIDLGKNHTTQKLLVSSVGFEERMVQLSDLEGNAIPLLRLEKVLEEVYIESLGVQGSMRMISGVMSTSCTITTQNTFKDSLTNFFSRPVMQLFPSPVMSGSYTNFSAQVKKAGKYKLQFNDASGKMLSQQYLNLSSQTAPQQIAIPASWNAGIYFAVLTDDSGKKISTQKLIVE